MKFWNFNNLKFENKIATKGENKIKNGNKSLFPHGCHFKIKQKKMKDPIRQIKYSFLYSLWSLIKKNETIIVIKINKKWKVFDALFS